MPAPRSLCLRLFCILCCLAIFFEQIDSANRHGILLEVVQLLTDLDLNIHKAYISSDGGWFMDGNSFKMFEVFYLFCFCILLFSIASACYSFYLSYSIHTSLVFICERSHLFHYFLLEMQRISKYLFLLLQFSM